MYSHPGKLSLAICPWVGEMSTSESWEQTGTPHDALAGPVSVVPQLTGVWLKTSETEISAAHGGHGFP